MVSEIGSDIGSGLSAVGNFLDTPGSFVRGLLAGEPGRAFGGIFDTSQRVSGEELIGGDNFWGGLGIEVLTDPLTYLTLGAGALTKAGKVASKAGTLPKAIVGQGGKLIEGAATQRLAQGLGTPARFGIPFTDIGVGFGGQRSADLLDTLGHGLRYSSPVRGLARMFQGSSRGLSSAPGQQIAQEVTNLERAGIAGARSEVAPLAREFTSTFDNVDNVRELQRSIELGDPLSQDLQHLTGAADTIRQKLDDQLQKEISFGLNSSALEDDVIQHYLTREMVELPGAKTKGQGRRRAIDPTHKSQRDRESILKNVPGGTDTLSRMSLDPLLSAKATTPLADRGLYLQSAYGITDAKQAESLADWLSTLDPRFSDPAINKAGVGVFTKHPVELLNKRLERGEKAMAAAEGVYKLLSQEARHASQILPGEATVDLRSVLVKAGLGDGTAPTGGAVAQMSQRLGGLASPDDLANYRVPQEIADDAARFVSGWTTPDALAPFIDSVDKFTQFFKIHALNRPSYYVRNLMGGQFQNWTIGLFSLPSMVNAGRLVSGGVVRGANDLPLFQGMGLTPKEATNAIADLAFEHNVVSRMTGPAGETLGLSDFLGEIPGMKPSRMRDPIVTLGKGFVSGEKGRFNPLNVRGVRANTNVFFPAKAGEQAGYWTEAVNRLTPWIEGLQNGIDPSQLAAKIRAAHVDYNALSDVERHVMRKVIPFYSFARGMVPWTLEELSQRPGGRLAQTTRAINLAGGDEDEILPEHVSRTAAIPLSPGESGDPRFLTSLGLMPEDALNMLGGDVFNLGSQLNPLIKAPIEAITGHSMFQAGPEGGRALSDMDSPLGRIYSNLAGLDQAPRAPTLLDTLAMNTVPSWVTSIKTATDERKGLGTKALNLGTGLKVTDVPERVQDAVIREHAQKLLKEEGNARTFEKVFLPQDELNKMPPEERARAEKLMGLLKMLSERAKERAESAKKLGIER